MDPKLLSAKLGMTIDLEAIGPWLEGYRGAVNPELFPEFGQLGENVTTSTQKAQKAQSVKTQSDSEKRSSFSLSYCESESGKKAKKKTNSAFRVVDASPGFRRVWKVYPVRRNGPDAVRAWVHFCLERHTATIELAIASQIAYKAKCDREGKFCPAFPYLHRYLKRRGWEDEVEITDLSAIERLSDTELAERVRRVRAGDLSALPKGIKRRR